jgi:glycine/D-amino acid oxidase-like deaminating enzyme
MQTDVLVVGQGLCGTWLSYWLQQAGVDFVVIDEEKPYTSTRVASGVINPVTGRRMSRTWLVDTLLPFAEQAYTQMHQFLLNLPLNLPLNLNLNLNLNPFLTPVSIIDFFNSPDRRLDFEKKATLFAEYLHWPRDEHDYREHFHYELGYGIIAPAYQVDLQSMLDGWRQYLRQTNRLLNERFHYNQLQLLPNAVQYQHIQAGQIIFADGIAAQEAGFFRLLPFAPNKGEALILEIEGLPRNDIYKKGNTITPWRGGYFWAGSSYINHYIDDQPSDAFRQSMEAWLRSVLKHPFKVLDHVAAIRPATVERRPFAGRHPQHTQVSILNGTGTKGVTLAPFFAKQLVDNLANYAPMMPEADVKRYARLLAKG